MTTPPTSSTSYRFPAEHPAELKLKVEMQVQAGLKNQPDVSSSPPVFRFLVSKKASTLSEGPPPFSMLFPGHKTPGTDIITVLIPPLVGMIEDGAGSVVCEGTLEAVVNKRLFVAAKFDMEFFKEPSVTAAVVLPEDTTSTKPPERSKAPAILSEEVTESVKDLLFSVRGKQPQKKEESKVAGKSPSYEPLKTQLKEMILKTLKEEEEETTTLASLLSD